MIDCFGCRVKDDQRYRIFVHCRPGKNSKTFCTTGVPRGGSKVHCSTLNFRPTRGYFYLLYSLINSCKLCTNLHKTIYSRCFSMFLICFFSLEYALPGKSHLGGACSANRRAGCRRSHLGFPTLPSGQKASMGH